MSEESLKDLGARLKIAREKAKLTQAEVGKIAKVHANYYARIERGEENPTFDVLYRILKALKLDSIDISKFKN